MLPRQSLSLCVLLLVLVSLSAGLSPCRAQDPGGQAPSAELPREVVATVNGRPIAEAQVVAKLLPRYGRAALQVLLVDAVLEDAARAAGITVTDEDVVLRVTEAEGQAGGNAGLRAQLARQGVTMAQFREDLRRDLLIGKLLEGRGALKVSEDDVRRLYRSQYGERVELAMILVEAEEEAKEVERRLAQGEDFGRLARELSRDTRSWGASGRLGQWGRGDLVPELEEKVFALKPGEVSQPLLTSNGYHIFKLLEKVPAKEVPLEQVRAELEQAVSAEQLAAAGQALVAELLRQADIKPNEKDYPWVTPPEVAERVGRTDTDLR